ncbi:MAG: PAS domain-containing protein [Ignavibacteria bacterium]|nr:PAS domain-containing protein [Ignavibacteria bacterium]
MGNRKFLWKLYYAVAMLSIIPLIVLGLYASSLFRDSLISADSDVLVRRSLLIKERLESSQTDSLDLNIMAAKLDSLSGSRITIILPNGKVASDSREDAGSMDNHADRPEVIEALGGKAGISQRYSFTLKEDFLYAAVPVYNKDGRISFILRTGYPLTRVNAEARSANASLFFSVVFFGLLILVGGYFALKRLLQPIYELRDAAVNFSGGNYSSKVYPAKEQELGMIADSLNSMAKQLDEKLDIIGEQNNLQEVVLKSMKEGVLAVDYEERVLMLNETASSILGISDKNLTGKTLQEVIRVSEIQKFFKKIISEGNPQEAEIILQHDKDKFLQLSGTLLYDMDNKAIGALVVFNDISNLKHLDTLKKDLVANVSHELRTPVTTIKGFIETLKEGAIDDPKNAERFLNIISKHIDRLNMLIDDLLILAKLEEKPEEVQLNEEKIRPLLRSVVEDFEFKANEKKITISIDCDEDLTARINRHLVEQAISNLVDNAVKYSDKKTSIEVGAYSDEGKLVFVVKDEGYGISQEHIPRLFERFYRIDKGRSREEGGTGLGLAIVKHIVNTMHGTIDVESALGEGTTFIVKIPQKYD